MFVQADILESKRIFAQRARERAPLVRAICKALDATNDGNIGENFFLDLLRRGFSEDEAREQMRIAVDWGRYGELFDLDSNTGQLDARPLPGPRRRLRARRDSRTRGGGIIACRRPSAGAGA